MSDAVHELPASTADDSVLERLSVLDRFLPVWILAAMALGLLLGRVVPGLDDALAAVQVGDVSLPIAVGLLVMMYPVLAKVRYDELGHVTGDRPLLGVSILLNWVVGPALMFALAWVFLPDLPAYRTGLVIVGLARCIAMVLIWNDLACGDREAAAILVALNAVFQILAFALLGYFYLQVLPGWLGLEQAALQVSVGAIARSVLVFLGIPLLAGFLTRTLGERAKGREWYETRLLPRIGPAALYGLLFTIVILFALQGAHDHLPAPGRGADRAYRCSAYFALMWGGSMLLTRGLRFRLPAGDRGLVHRCRQQLRARDRGGDRRLRRHQRPGARRRGRTPDRGAGAGRAGLRRAVGAPLLPRPAGPSRPDRSRPVSSTVPDRRPRVASPRSSSPASATAAAR